MPLLETINADLKTAMLAGDKPTTSTLRILKSAFMYAKTADGNDLPEAELIKIVRREVKKRAEGASGFRSSGNVEKAQEEEQEALILERYLPAKIESTAIEAFVSQLFSDQPAIQKGDAIRQTSAHFSGNAEGKVIAEIVSKHLS